MRVVRLPLAHVPAADWDRLAGDSFFASRGFVELWRHAGGRPMAWIAEDAGRIAALLPGVEYGRGPWRRLASLPDGCYGGVRLDGALEAERPRFVTAILDAIARAAYAKACVFDFHRSLGAHSAFFSETETTRLAEIGVPGWQPPDAKLRSQVRKAGREGVRVEPFDASRHRDGLLSLVAGSARHHGRRQRHPAALYDALAALAARDPRVRWFWCERDGRPVATHVYFVECDALQAWQSHFDRTFSFLKPNQYIRHAACLAAARDGVRWLNLGCTPPEATGLAYYKARWGGTTVRYASWYRWRGLGALARVWYPESRLRPRYDSPGTGAAPPLPAHEG